MLFKILGAVVIFLMLALFGESAFAAGVVLSKSEQNFLLDISRRTMVEQMNRKATIQVDAGQGKTAQKGGCLVILRHRRRDIRGLSGNLLGDKPLFQSVIDASLAVARAAGGRIRPMDRELMVDSKVEIHLINQPKDLVASTPDELLKKLKPKVDGAILFTRFGSAILSPREWEHYPKAAEFLEHLCLRQNAPKDTWKTDFKNIRIQTFQGTWFREKSYHTFSRKKKGIRTKKLPRVMLVNTQKKTLHPVLLQKSTSGQTIRLANMSRSKMTAITLRIKGESTPFAVASLAPGEATSWHVLSKDKTNVTLVGEYTHHTMKRTIHIPSAPGIASIVFNYNGFYSVYSSKNDLPIYPQPKQLELTGSWCDLSGLPIQLQVNANEKSKAIAQTLAARLLSHLKLAKAPAIKLAGKAPKGFYVLSVGKAPESWSKVVPEAEKIFARTHETLREQAYYLRITASGAVLVAPGSWGLAYGSLTLMQIAKGMSKGSTVPCLTIKDWPDMEVRTSMTSNSGIPLDQLHRLSVTAWEGRYHQLRWARPWQCETRPELNLGKRVRKTKAQYKTFINKVRGMGIDPGAGDHLGALNWLHNRPYNYMVGDTYYWAMKEVIDENLELYRPKMFNMGFSENQFAMRAHFYPQRQLPELRDTMVTLMKFLRRRGVMGEWESDPLMQSGGSRASLYKWTFGKKFPDGYYDYSATFPGDLTWGPWYYWCVKPSQVLNAPGHLREQAKTGLPVVMLAYGDNVRHHVASVLALKEKYPNVQGISTSWFGGGSGQCLPPSIMKDAGPFWNSANAERPIDFEYEKEAVTNWECLLDADPPESVEAALKRLDDKAWRVWLHAREQLISAGLSTVPTLLEVMSKAKGESRDRIEGCLSRNARDARNGRKRGKLDVAKIVEFLNDKNEVVRDMAAELLASASTAGPDELRKRIADKVAGASCIRALRIIKDKSIAPKLIEILETPTLPVKMRTEAARVLGFFRSQEAVAVLRKAMTQTKDAELRKAALWSLVLLNCKAADKEIAAFLDHPDQDTRYRAAIGLVTLESPEIKRLVPWLLKDRHSLEIAAWSMFMIWDWKEAAVAIEKLTPPKDVNSKKRLVQLIGLFSGKGKKVKVSDHWH